MNKDQALDLALEALEYFTDTSVSSMDHAMAEELITAIKQARSAPVQEPAIKQGWDVDTLLDKPAAPVQEPPPECQTEAEKRAYAFGWWKALEANRAAQRQWVGLTDGDIQQYVESRPYYGYCNTEYREGIEQGAKWARDQIAQPAAPEKGQP
jgi:hypothetical protein